MQPLKLSFCLIICCTFFSCRQTGKKIVPPVTAAPAAANTDIERPSQPYISYSDSITAVVKKLKDQKNISAINKLVYHTISVDMPLYWHGTKWDFNGTTRTPGDSTIACGYFITTILQDIGLKINRSWLAQQPSSVLIKATCNKIERFAEFSDLEKYMDNTPPHSILIIGLDFHTGFIIKDNSNTYFFHSNYIDRAGVTKELIAVSRALKASKSFMIGNLAANESYLMR
ncbi:MAG: hypothetical protein H7Y86_10225 [Rhizobacter sp.]|nr:hypothetical protein [Ferruginibacter sp.]